MLKLEAGAKSHSKEIRSHLGKGMWLGIRGSLITGSSFRGSNPWMLDRNSDVDIFMVVPKGTPMPRGGRFVKRGGIWLSFEDPLHPILKNIVQKAFVDAGLEQPEGITIRVFAGEDAFSKRKGQREYFRLFIAS